ncbi:MAG: COX15/CtaA family protein [Acidobacteriota bacterium]
MTETRQRRSGFAIFCWVVLACTVAVILWGAYVRATGSGAGCGSHWPTCNGEVIPRSPSAETLIEFTHRLSSGLLGLMVLGLLAGAWRKFPARHRVRLGAFAAFLLVLAEALIGAGLVRFEWVADNASVARVIVVGFHLANTFLLLAALTLTAWWAGGGRPIRPRLSGGGGWIAACLTGILLVGAVGAVTALGDTLLLQSGIQPQHSRVVDALVWLRYLHPLLALMMVVPVMAASMQFSQPPTRLCARLLTGAFHLQILLGVVNILLKAPVWMQMVHLLVADALWIILVLLAATAWGEGIARQDAEIAK